MDINDKQSWQNWEAEMPDGDQGFLRQLWEKSKDYKQDYQPDTGKAFASFQQKAASPNHGIPSGKIVKMGSKGILLRIAASILVLFVSVYVWKSYFPSSSETLVQSSQDPKQLSLPDGSEITLNKFSELGFENGFGKGDRAVRFQGEGFFNIAKDPSKPFTIKTETAEITVLGTSFNVLSYPDDNRFEVYVETGKVKVNILHSSTAVTLGPGEYFTFDKASRHAGRAIEKSGVPIAWKTGVLQYKGRPISEVLTGVEQLFDIKFQFDSTQLNANCLQSLTVRRGKMQEALQALERSCEGLKFVKESEKLYVIVGNCCQ